MTATLALNTTQRQTQTISPRLQHAVRLLQMSSLEFAAMVADQLGRNPFLEEDGEAEDAPAASERDTPLEERETWRSEGGSSSLRRADDDQIAAMELMAERGSLAGHLHGQLNVMQLSPRERMLAALVVDALDADGYLRVPLHELADIEGLLPPVEDVELRIALKRVQALDPPGVGARDVAECLSLQLPAIECPEMRALARLIVNERLALLAQRNPAALAHALDAPLPKVEAACRRLRMLDPRPGWRFESSMPSYVIPDVLAHCSRGRWQVALNPAVIPRVRFNQVYADLFRRHRSEGCAEMASHLQEARWTVRNVEQRFSTILDVADAIVRRQQHFLEFGAMAMKPLGLREIAQELGIHESTVSRVTNNKYIATPSGVYELKYFFSRALHSTSGGACSGTAIRGLVKEMIESETPGQPLSDPEIARRLGAQGLTVARRTVTKYRQALRIEAVERRRP
ncbi:MAG TPA: RNA polymerase factor sigma-54 [Ramlibacter sp.]